MPTPKYTPAQFKKVYAPLRARGLSKQDIADAMGYSTRTLERKLKDKRYVAVMSDVSQIENREIARGENQSERIINKAYELHERGIKDAIKNKEYKKARKISLEALQIAKTEAEVKRVFLSIGSVHIGDNINIVINNFKDELYELVKKYIKKEQLERFCIEVDEIQMGEGQ